MSHPADSFMAIFGFTRVATQRGNVITPAAFEREEKPMNSVEIWEYVDQIKAERDDLLSALKGITAFALRVCPSLPHDNIAEYNAAAEVIRRAEEPF